MGNKVFGYARVSSKEQNEGRQVKAINEYCKCQSITLDERDIYIDKKSGKDFNREEYQLLKRTVRNGDIVVIKEMDRLGRNKAEIKKEIEWYNGNGIVLRILDIPTTLMDFSAYDSSMAKAMMEMVNNVLIEVLGTIAEEERNKIKQRQREGIELAKAEGKHLGRPKTEYPIGWEKAYEHWRSGEETAIATMKQLELKRNTFYRLVKQYENTPR